MHDYLQQLMGEVFESKHILKQKFTRTQIGQMWALHRQGMSNIKIAKHMGCTKSFVGKVFNLQRRMDDTLMLIDEYENGVDSTWQHQ